MSYEITINYDHKRKGKKKTKKKNRILKTIDNGIKYGNRTSMVMGVNTKRLVMLKAKAARRNPSWYLCSVEAVFQGCKYPKDATDTAQHTPTIEK